MRPAAIEAQLRAILSRASEQEARRQDAVKREDWPTASRCEVELRQLWRAHAELERHEDSAA